MAIVSVTSGSSKPASTAHEKVKGDIRIRLCVIIFISTTVIMLIITGAILQSTLPEGNYWNSVLPIASGAVFGLVGFIAGKKSNDD